MPAESLKDDCGWVAGPIKRELFPFLGEPPGPKDTSLDQNSTRVELMATQITAGFKEKWLEFTKAHAFAWRAVHPGWRKDLRELCI